MEQNLESLKKKSSCEIIFMVKANAYGHGIGRVTDFIQSRKIVSNFGVASIAELVDINLVDDSNYWIFSELDLKNNISAYKKENILAVISNLSDLKFYLENVSKRNIVLKFNTGMNRLGIRLEELDELFLLLKQHNVQVLRHIMTHFSSSYLKINSKSKTKKQFTQFEEIKERLGDKNITFLESSCSNSGAIEQGFGLDESHIRPGLMLYGVASYGFLEAKRSDDMQVISSLRSQSLSKEFYQKGDRVGYGLSPIPFDGWLVTIPLGYGDGILNYYVGAEINCGDLKGKIFGRVNMDLCFVLFKEEPKSSDVYIWQDNLAEFSAQVGAIPYQVLTSISQRVPKLYKN